MVGGGVFGIVWGTIYCLKDALAEMVHMTIMTGVLHLSREAVLTSVTGIAAGVLCSEGCWANSCLL